MRPRQDATPWTANAFPKEAFAPLHSEFFLVHPSSFLPSIWKQELSANPPGLVTGNSDQDNHDDDSKNRIRMTASAGDFNQCSQPVSRSDKYLRHDDPAPADSIHSSKVVPNVCFSDGK